VSRRAPTPVEVRRRRVIATSVVVLVVTALLSILIAGVGGPSRESPAVAAAIAAATRATTHAAPRVRPVPVRPKPKPKPVSPTNAAISRVLTRFPYIVHGGREHRDIALTFDDGPGPFTPGVLRVLHRLHVPATFFAIGEMERYFSASSVKEGREGDVIGDHTETHPALAHLSSHDQQAQIDRQAATLRRLGLPSPRLFRPPYGSFNAATFRILRQEGMLMVLWSVDTEDYTQPGVHAIVRNALAGARPGEIIVMHDAGGTRTQTIAALPTLIHDLRGRHYHLVTIPEMLIDDPPTSEPPLHGDFDGD
jgi:peptidoglycan/xylan/chitin deacetylase (PgdA/CDA1 family)